MNKTKQKETHRYREQTHGYRGGRGKTGVLIGKNYYVCVCAC